MRGRGTPYIAFALILAGIIGMLASGLYLGLSVGSRGTVSSGGRGSSGFASNGERIYYTAVGHMGPVRAVWDVGRFGGMMRRRRGAGTFVPACVNCHGADGRGGPVGMMGSGVVAADIRYSTLTSPQVEGTRTVPGWTEAQIATAIRGGIQPDGSQLDLVMPRWKMDAVDMRDVIAYLKELSPQ